MKFMKVENIQKEYGSGETAVHALKGISFSLEKGAFAAITGESGSGKSTLLTILGGMCSPSGGKILYEGEDMYALNEEKRASFRNRNLGFVFQNFHLVPYLTLEENVMLPLSIRKIKGKDKLLKARSALERVGLGGKFTRLPSEVSGGEQERAAIARAIVHNPPLLLADEPTGNLDSGTGEAVMDLLKALNGEGMTILMVTHSNEWAARAGERIFLSDGHLLLN